MSTLIQSCTQNEAPISMSNLQLLAPTSSVETWTTSSPRSLFKRGSLRSIPASQWERTKSSKQINPVKHWESHRVEWIGRSGGDSYFSRSSHARYQSRKIDIDQQEVRRRLADRRVCIINSIKTCKRWSLIRVNIVCLGHPERAFSHVCVLCCWRYLRMRLRSFTSRTRESCRRRRSHFLRLGSEPMRYSS